LRLVGEAPEDKKNARSQKDAEQTHKRNQPDRQIALLTHLPVIDSQRSVGFVIDQLELITSHPSPNRVNTLLNVSSQ